MGTRLLTMRYVKAEGSDDASSVHCTVNQLHSGDAWYSRGAPQTVQRMLMPAESELRTSGSLLMLLFSLSLSWFPSLLSAHGCFPQNQMYFQTLKTDEVGGRKCQCFGICFNNGTLVCQQTQNAEDAFQKDNIQLSSNHPRKRVFHLCASKSSREII